MKKQKQPKKFLKNTTIYLNHKLKEEKKINNMRDNKSIFKTKFLTTLTILIKGLSVVFYLDKIYFKC